MMPDQVFYQKSHSKLFYGAINSELCAELIRHIGKSASYALQENSVTALLKTTAKKRLNAGLLNSIKL